MKKRKSFLLHAKSTKKERRNKVPPQHKSALKTMISQFIRTTIVFLKAMRYSKTKSWNDIETI
jgi:hypothetical protein